MVGPLTKDRAPSETREQIADGKTPRPSRGILRAAIVAMRPQEWVKNLLVFAGLLFSAKFREFDAVVYATITFAAFCAIASAGPPDAFATARRAVSITSAWKSGK